MSLSPVASQTAVTALHLDSELLYVGVGSTLKVFNIQTGSLVSATKVLAKNKIHGIVPSAKGVIVWGGRSIAIVKEQAHEFGLHDWIVAVGVDTRNIYIQTAHNEVVLVDASSLEVLQTQRCIGERSILYSGALFCSGESILCAAGTVMGGVVVWDVTTGALVHNFTDHEGSIFNVAFSDDGAYLASCSDDWSIIIWDLKRPGLVARGWGHAARIWKLAFSGKNLYSASEDCSVRKWEVSSNNQLKCVDIFIGHQGRNIWSLALHPESTLMATGGGDGKLLLWDTDKRRTRTTFSFDDVVAEGSPLKTKTGKRSPNFKNCIVHSNILLGVLTSGDVLFTKLPASPSQLWHHAERKLDPYALLRPVNDSIIAVGRDGRVISVAPDGSVSTFELSDHGNVPVREALVLDNGTLITQGQDHTSRDLVVYDAAGQYLYHVTCPEPEFALTAATLDKNTLIAGSRFGSIAVFTVQPDQTTESAHIYPRALGEGRDGITSIRIDNNSVFAADRAGAYGSFSFTSDRGLRQTLCNRYTRTNIDGSCLINGELIVYGFKNEKFIVWNITSDVELFAEDCGSRKRAWSINIDSSQISFSYLRNNNPVCVQERSHYPLTLIPGTHGREIRDLSVFEIDKGRTVVASAGEDTAVVLSWLGTQVFPALRLQRHTSGIQCVQWHPEHFGFLVTAGGKGEIIVWRAAVNGNTIGAVEVGRVAVIKNVTSELRVTDISLGHGVIAAAYSDSTVRIFTWQERTDGRIDLGLLCEGRYSDRCLLNIDLIRLKSGFKLLVTSTDGHLVVWNSDKIETILENTPSLRYKIHQSGVRCSAIEVDESSQTVDHFSGGDDNSIRGVRLGSDGTQELLSVPSAHASTVTGISIYDDDHIVTTSADQKVRLWARATGGLKHSEFSDVSDTGAIVAIREGVIVAGCGMQKYLVNV